MRIKTTRQRINIKTTRQRVDQTTRQRINYFYVNEAFSSSEHRVPTYQS